MQRLIAAGALTACLMITSAAWAFAPDTTGVPETQTLRPPSSEALGHGRGQNKMMLNSRTDDGSFTFLGSESLPPAVWALDGAGNVAHPAMLYFQKKVDVPGVELLQTSENKHEDETTVSYVQTLHGVPVLGTFALAHVRGNKVTYARHYLVTPTSISTNPRVDSVSASTDALADVLGFAQDASVAGVPSLAVLYLDGTPTLVWQVSVSAQKPFGSYDEFVDAQNGGVVGRHKTSLDAVSGTVNAMAEPTCEGENPVNTRVPYVQWTPGWATGLNGTFSSTSSVSKAQVQLNGAYFSIYSADNENYMWTPALQNAPAVNNIQLNGMPLGQIDPYIYLNQARAFLRDRVLTVPELRNSRIWQWFNGQVQVNANLPSGYDGYSCNAFYDPSDTTLNFYVDYPAWGCNNSGRVNKIVFHEYGHSVHHHLTANAGTFDMVLSEGVADYTMATITRDPNVTGLINGCNSMLSSPGIQRPARPTWRTCVNTYNYCNSSKCTSFPGDEAHHAAPIMCGALWDMRSALIKQYGEDRGALTADQIFLRFLTFATDMGSAYSAAIAADEDPDGNPANGTVHSCAINQAFLGDNGGVNHFPDARAERVPCNPQ